MHIAIVGAGIAGLSAAQRLLDAGHSIDIFEKSRGLGGRLHTRRGELASVDLGAQYFTARDPRFIRQCEQWQQAGLVAEWPVTPWRLQGNRLYASPDDTRRLVGTPTMNAALRSPPTEMVVHRHTRIVALDHHDHQWHLESESGAFVAADAVIVATPAAQARPLIASSTKLNNALNQVSMEPCWAVALVFETATGIAPDAAFAEDHPVSWLARNSSKPGRNGKPETWVLHASTSWTLEHLEAPPEQVGEMLAHWFNTTLKPAGAPLQVQAHRWRFARTSSRLAAADCIDLEHRIALCGDWCAGGRVEGAWLSGQDIAEQLFRNF